MHGWTDAELGLFCVVSTFYDTSMPQNAKITWEGPSFADGWTDRAVARHTLVTVSSHTQRTMVKTE